MATKVWDSCDETKKGNLTLHHIGLAAYPKRIMKNKILCGDSLEVLKDFEDNYFDSVVTDPPYGISFMSKSWDYDVPQVELWKEVYRVLKPGGHLLSFAGSRTYHRMAVNIEDAGFEIRDMLGWLYGSGFPKSHNIGKAVDKIQGNEREIESVERSGKTSRAYQSEEQTTAGIYSKTKGNSEWEGWGTALKPAHEPIVMARKPFNTLVAENVLTHGTGGINIDECRVGGKEGRFPANIIHDGSEEVLEVFEESSRFFYCAKASKAERGNKNNHPTVKPIKLMEYLVKLVTPKEGIVLEPFAGSGTTLIACKQQGFNYIGIEREQEYCDIAEARLKGVQVQGELF